MSGKRRKRARLIRGPSDGNGPIPLRPPAAPYAPIAALVLVIGIGVSLSTPTKSTRVMAAAWAAAAGVILFGLVRAMLRKVEAGPDGLIQRGGLSSTRNLRWADVAFVRVREVRVDKFRVAQDVRIGAAAGRAIYLPLTDAFDSNGVVAMLKRRTPGAIWIDEDSGSVTGRLPEKADAGAASLSALRRTESAARRAVHLYTALACAMLCVAAVSGLAADLLVKQRAVLTIFSLAVAAACWFERPKARQKAARLRIALDRLERSLD